MPIKDIRNPALSSISIQGYKSLRGKTSIEVRPLTILAGANSSGKSSIVQPLLLIKQTLEASYDPGALKIDGPNVQFSNSEQFFTSLPRLESTDLTITIGLGSLYSLSNIYRKASGRQVEIAETTQVFGSSDEGYIITTLRPDMSNDEIVEQFPELEQFRQATRDISKLDYQWQVTRNRCFLVPNLFAPLEDGSVVETDLQRNSFSVFRTGMFSGHLQRLIHVPGIRKNPERVYPLTPAVGPQFEGAFQNYVASVIHNWRTHDDERIQQLNQQLKLLGLTSAVSAHPISETDVEIVVGRTMNSHDDDVVSLADVGFGVSQVMPVLVALLTAVSDQIVYIEQPELHLHPRAQHKLAEAFADAANRGVRVVVETHSDLFLLGIQTLVAEGKLSPDKVIMHWFERDEDGVTHISSTDLEEDGAFSQSDWPEDFAEVTLKAQSDYLDAVEPHEAEPSSGD
jgi:hypothetical protein